ncbi:MAG: M20/M25/M40 family metallo-hydrolase [Pyramidobacter sp.]|nr:M20/M25/M40 family metallo-hydrolase [Pyramidobacter sp.]
MTPKEKALAWVDEHFDECLAELKNAVACESYAGNEAGLEKMRDTLEADLRRSGLVTQRHPVEGGNALISASLAGDAPETMLFYNHYDVVLPGKTQNWANSAPFSVDERDGFLYGRGVSDDKGGLYYRIHAVRAMMEANGRVPLNLKFLVEGDEETSSPSMSRFAREHVSEFKELTAADVCLWENGCNDAAGHPFLRCGVRAAVAFDLRVTTAKSDVHGRMGATVPSASWRLIWALASLKDAQTERVTIDGFYDDVLPVTEADRQVLRDFPSDEARMKEALQLKSFVRGATGEQLKQQMYMEPSFSVCALEAGEPHNGVRGIVPHTAYARISFYLVANQDPDDIEKKLRAHLQSRGFGDVEVTRCGGESRPVRTPPDHPFRFRACEAASRVYDKPMVIELTQMGAGPASVLADAWPELPIFGMGPANTTANHHAPEENMKIEHYKNAIKCLIELCYSYTEQ